MGLRVIAAFGAEIRGAFNGPAVGGAVGIGLAFLGTDALVRLAPAGPADDADDPRSVLVTASEILEENRAAWGKPWNGCSRPPTPWKPATPSWKKN